MFNTIVFVFDKRVWLFFQHTNVMKWNTYTSGKIREYFISRKNNKPAIGIENNITIWDTDKNNNFYKFSWDTFIVNVYLNWVSWMLLENVIQRNNEN